MKMLNKKILGTLSTGCLMLMLSFGVSAQTTSTSSYVVPAPRTPCSPTAQQAIANATNEQLALAHRLLDPFNAQLLQPSKDANGATAASLLQQCVGQYWPGGGLRLPTLEDLIHAAEALIAEACSMLRQKIASDLPSMNTMSFNTGIPGLPPIGYNTGIGSSSSVWTVNGQNPVTGLSNTTSTGTTPITTQISNSLPSSPSPPANSTSTQSLVNQAKGLFGG
jgi:hypothetical protein